MDEYLCRTAFLYCGGRNGTFDKPFGKGGKTKRVNMWSV